jgi:ribosomal protein S18 acetylase RimI-like enzyme
MKNPDNLHRICKIRKHLVDFKRSEEIYLVIRDGFGRWLKKQQQLSLIIAAVLIDSMDMDYTYKTIDALPDITADFVEQYNVLIRQLSLDPKSVTKEELEEVKKRTASELLLCVFTQEEVLVGFVQGTYLCTPPRYALYINSVVVDASERGAGLGSELMKKVQVQAIERWSTISTVSFTSRPDRNTRGFYERLGFTARDSKSDNETTVFVKYLDQD